jgi:hypothetical protein
MAEFKLNRFRYNWRGQWIISTAYNRDDVVRYGGKVYVCIRQHSSASTNIYVDINYIPPGETVGQPAWTEMLDGYNFSGPWAGTTFYALNDLVVDGGNVWRCNTPHTSTITRQANSSYWTNFVSGFNLTGNWLFGTIYSVGDVVLHGGILYRCLTGHSSGARFETDLAFNYWESIFENVEYRGEWVNYTRYKLNDLVNYGSNIWICTLAHDGGFTENEWDIFAPGQKFIGQWSNLTSYVPNDIVRHGGNLYVAKTLNDGISPDIDSVAWDLVLESVFYRGTWSNTSSYAPGDLVIRGGNVYRALKDSTGVEPSDTTASDGSTLGTERWSLVVPAVGWKNYWTIATDYGINDYVTFNGNTYRCIVSHVSEDWSYPDSGSLSTPYWEIVLQGSLISAISQKGDLLIKDKSIDGSTLQNSKISIGEDRQLLKVSPAEGATVAGYTWSVSQADPLPPDIIEQYVLDGDIKNYKPPLEMYVGATYTFDQSQNPEEPLDRNVEHPWMFGLLPDGGGFSVRQPYEENVVYKLDNNVVDRLTWVDTGDREAAVKRTISITITENTPKTLYYWCYLHVNEGNAITIKDLGNSVHWEEWGRIPRNYYVDPLGEDIPGNGLNPEYPWKTIRYACENAGSYSVINVAAGYYNEILPIIVPANVSLEGSELRSSVVVASPPIAALVNDIPYTKAVLTHIKNLMDDLILNVAITPTAGNTVSQVRNLDPGSNASSAQVKFLIDDIIAYIDHRVDESAADPSVYGTNTRSALEAQFNTYRILAANIEFIAAEATAFVSNSFPSYVFDPDLCKRDMRRYVNAWQYDIIYTGNYKSILAARYYYNAVEGSQLEDMFLVRDSVNIKNFTFMGLNGTLTPDEVPVTAGNFVIGQSYTILSLGTTNFTLVGAVRNEVGLVFEATGPGTGTGIAETNVVELVRRPTAGAYVSLDPGWGPTDERCWITSRSPYVQNITLFGTGCVGQKIDGDLHDGGNKSIVSNDYTTVLSDGIGAWVTNQGRAELVSVFSYYCHIGYLAENGGIIRGTNGNNSYGRHGAVASGVSDLETPLTATVDNRTQEATVGNAFAGEVYNQDEIILFEFNNAGQNYTNATYSIVSSGAGAQLVQDEFRDDAVFEVRVLDEGDSTAPGGGGYLIVGNNAQAGNTTSITLASNDDNLEADYLGTRITIVSGTGTGQYGYITSYDDTSQGATLVATVSRESDGQPGWDHVISGTHAIAVLDTTTQYRIEPRIEFSHPGYAATGLQFSSVLDYDKIIFGSTTENFAGVSGELGTGTTIDIPPDEATFNVVKTGSTYSVTINNAGAGYQIGDEITLLGTNLGGFTPANDITITVSTVTDDSTNSVASFSFEGTAYGGKFAVTALGQNIVTWSRDGTNWSNNATPNGGAGSTAWLLSPGNNRWVGVRPGTSIGGYSLDLETWTTITLPVSRTWTDIAYGDGKWIAVASNGNTYIYSTDGTTWTEGTFPDFTADSTIGDWTNIAYGKNTFVALCKNTNVVAVSSDNGVTWTQALAQSDSTIGQWVGLAYGSNRFVAISEQQNAAAYSFDGLTWYSVTLPNQDGSTSHQWRDLKYGQGVFFAVGDTGGRDIGGDVTATPSTFCITSEDGIVWTSRSLNSAREWRSVAFGNPGNNPMWLAVARNTDVYNKIITGCRTKGRPIIASGRIGSVRIWEPGSGYVTAPSMTVTDPGNTSDVSVSCRLGNGVLAQPTFITRGTGYRTSTTTVEVSGDGFADIIPVGKYLYAKGLQRYPKTGSNLYINGSETLYTIVFVVESGGVAGNFNARFQVSPELEIIDSVPHDAPLVIREQFSQVRLTGHDFLDIGVGSLTASNYPTVDRTFFSPENEVVDENGGRVFYTSSDQDGNFRVGELFQVEQAAGIVTISADFFDLNGLSELALGGVRLGGSGTVIREFSTDPLFTADSNNVIPTQRAIRSYLQRRLTLGGSEVSTGQLTAGVVIVGPQRFDTTTSARINVPYRMVVSGPFAGIAGRYLAQLMFFKSFKDD